MSAMFWASATSPYQSIVVVATIDATEHRPGRRIKVFAKHVLNANVLNAN
jgi:hypothetical protein